MSKQEIVIEDIAGKYENPIAELVRVACQFTSTIMLVDETHRVNAKSIMGVMAFCRAGNSEICIEASGDDEKDALQAMVKLLRGQE
ncbi:MAG: HPr family phosphocarrier protein [Lachnospiraceae bacterium]|nr:HPr family phosphocarrier protein [Lachnospiraceae bacterium]